MILLAPLLLQPSTPSARLAIIRNGKRIGYATVSQRIVPGGGKYVIERVQIGAGASATRVTIESSYAVDGSATRKVQEVQGPGVRRRVVATFDNVGANVVLVQDGQSKSLKFPLVAHAPRADASEFWFLRDRPAKEAKVRAYVFDPAHLEWQLRETRYVGPRVVKIGKKGEPCFELQTEIGTRKALVQVDAQGLPVLVDDGETRMERVNPSE